MEHTHTHTHTHTLSLSLSLSLRYEALEDKATKDAKDMKVIFDKYMKVMIDKGISLIVTMWKRLHNYVIMSKAAPVLTAFFKDK